MPDPNHPIDPQDPQTIPPPRPLTDEELEWEFRAHEPWKITPEQKGLAVFIIALAIGAAIYRFVVDKSIGGTSAMFIGIPAALALLLALAPTPKSATGSILRGIALFLLIVAPLLGEGYLCILFASPLFFGVGLLIGLIIDYSRKNRTTALSSVLILLIPMSLEGVVPQLTHDRTQTVSVTQILAASADAVTTAIAHPPNIDAPLPRFLRIGFPRPLSTQGGGLALNDTRSLHFSGAEGDPPGDLTMRVTASGPGHLTLVTVSDTSKLTQWVHWQSSEVTWQAIDATHTRVTCEITFNRQLDPFWYFTPWERLAVTQAARYLIASNATPHI